MIKDVLKNHMFRIFSNIIFFLSVLFLPWWISFLLAIILLFRFTRYYELFFFAFLSDSLFGKPITMLWDLNIGFFISAFVLFTLVSVLKQFVSFSRVVERV